jgi:hypothetical protein
MAKQVEDAGRGLGGAKGKHEDEEMRSPPEGRSPPDVPEFEGRYRGLTSGTSDA